MTSTLRRLRLLAPVSLVILAAQPPAFAGMYKWVDDQGNVHFSDTPRSSSAQEIDVPESDRLNMSKDAHGPREPKADGTKGMEERRDALRERAANEERKARERAQAEKRRQLLDPAYRAQKAAEQKAEQDRRIAIERCEKAGMRRDCDSAEMVKKFRPLTPEEKARVQERRARREKEMRRTRRLDDELHRRNLYGPQ